VDGPSGFAFFYHWNGSRSENHSSPIPAANQFDATNGFGRLYRWKTAGEHNYRFWPSPPDFQGMFRFIDSDSVQVEMHMSWREVTLPVLPGI